MKTRNCFHCSAEFEPYRGQKFCSVKCRSKAASKKKYSCTVGDILTCKICNNSFEMMNSRNTKYCSKKCVNKAHYIWRNSNEVQKQKKKEADREAYLKNKAQCIACTKLYREKNRAAYNASARKHNKNPRRREYYAVRNFLNAEKLSLFDIPLEVKQIVALKRVSTGKIKDKKILEQIKKGETHYAYI